MLLNYQRQLKGKTLGSERKIIKTRLRAGYVKCQIYIDFFKHLDYAFHVYQNEHYFFHNLTSRNFLHFCKYMRY